MRVAGPGTRSAQWRAPAARAPAAPSHERLISRRARFLRRRALACHGVWGLAVVRGGGPAEAGYVRRTKRDTRWWRLAAGRRQGGRLGGGGDGRKFLPQVHADGPRRFAAAQLTMPAIGTCPRTAMPAAIPSACIRVHLRQNSCFAACAPGWGNFRRSLTVHEVLPASGTARCRRASQAAPGHRLRPERRGGAGQAGVRDHGWCLNI